MGKSLDEFFDSYGALKVLVQNLEANMEVFGDEMSEDAKEGLMRTNLIMIRQCLRDFGVEE